MVAPVMGLDCSFEEYKCSIVLDLALLGERLHRGENIANRVLSSEIFLHAADAKFGAFGIVRFADPVSKNADARSCREWLFDRMETRLGNESHGHVAVTDLDGGSVSGKQGRDVSTVHNLDNPVSRHLDRQQRRVFLACETRTNKLVDRGNGLHQRSTSGDLSVKHSVDHGSHERGGNSFA